MAVRAKLKIMRGSNAGKIIEINVPQYIIGRTPGWLAQWQEMLLDKEQKIARPRQVYIGPPKRDYVPIEKRS